MKQLKIAILIVGALVLFACGSNQSVDTSDSAADDPEASSRETGELAASCGDFVFASGDADLGALPPLDEDAQAALDNLVEGPTGVEAEQFAGAEMVIAERTDDELTLLGEIDGDSSFLSAQFRREDGEWQPRSWGGCRVSISAQGFGSATTRLDPDIEPDPESSTLALVINERACASGQAPTDRQVVSSVTETETTIEIITSVEPVSGDAECPGNPWHPVAVTLEAPLGERMVFDTHTGANELLTWPPNLDD